MAQIYQQKQTFSLGLCIYVPNKRGVSSLHWHKYINKNRRFLRTFVSMYQTKGGVSSLHRHIYTNKSSSFLRSLAHIHPTPGKFSSVCWHIYTKPEMDFPQGVKTYIRNESRIFLRTLAPIYQIKAEVSSRR